MDACTMSIFLRYVGEEFPDEYCVLFLDKAGWHQAGTLEVPFRMRLVYLPPYSPELNPVEHILGTDTGERVREPCV
jgi:transposase